MVKRIIMLLLCLGLMLSAALPVSAEKAEVEPEMRTLILSSQRDFLEFADNCRLDSYSRDLRVVLNADIDLRDVNFEAIPIFCGTFEGNGHRIRGLDLAKEGSVQGLFRYLTEGAVVQDLHLEGSVQPGGSSQEVGALAGSNAGSILNCSFTGTVSGKEYIGGLVGVNTVTGVVDNCSTEGNVYGNHFVGGLVGRNNGVVRNCENRAQVNETAKQNDVALSDITLESLTNSESVNTVTDIGGIAGSSVGVIRDCVNHGAVGYQHMGYNIGGIAGTQSGYIGGCVNNGSIRGRKEVGGIVGQMEPTALVEYEEDALQILQRQLDGMGSIVSQTSANVQSTGEALYNQVGTLYYYIGSAQDAIMTLIPDSSDPQLPDADTIHAAKNNISSSLSGMSQTLQGMSAVTQSAVGTLSNNLHALQNQMNAMRTTLGNVSETLGGSIRDVSDLDTEEDLTGKVADCVNTGAVLADLNAGGITGAMALENDLDPEDDWHVTGENSLNFESELRCVILNCENSAVITAQKQNAGGIAGWQLMGLVKNSRNTGRLDAENADYVGGVSGQSTGYIRSSSAKCEISGGTYTGGIAGSGTIVTNCYSMSILKTGTEKLGAILGFQEEDTTEEETPVAWNYYYSVNGDTGGIDGISYREKAEPVDLDTFLELEDLPEMFQRVTLRFRYEKGGEQRFVLNTGEAFPENWIPLVPYKSGSAGQWEGLAETDLSCVTFDQVFEADYDSYDTVIPSGEKRGEKPILLLQGGFATEAELTLRESGREVPLESAETLLERWDVEVTEKGAYTARYCLPEGADADRIKLLLHGAEGWREAVCSEDGSYLVFSLEAGDNAFAVIRTPSYWWLLTAAGGLILLAAGTLLYRRRKKTA